MSASPTGIVRSTLRAGSYYDSVVLMQLQRGLAARPGVLDAGVVMATPANQEILAASGLLTPEADEARAGDLLIAVRAESEETAIEALAGVDSLLRTRRPGGSGEASSYRPRSLAGALRLAPEARWALISVPGRYAAQVADDALERDLSVFLYSDNVPLADEVALKRKAGERGLLVLGPDCGTAIVGGAGLGFANHVRRGPIGLVGASGTGLQLVTSRIHELGSGVSQAIGTGGRDLSEAVGGATALQALDLLARDPETEVIVLLSKPPSPAVGTRLLRAASRTGKPVAIGFLGFMPPLRRLGNLHFAASLAEAAELATTLATGLVQEPQGARILEHPDASHATPSLRGLFSGGTLAYEVQLGLQSFLAPLWSNIPTGVVKRLADLNKSVGHTLLDLGEDDFTVGRLHPMIDPDLRERRLRQEAEDPEVGLILLDLVLGSGAHADPAGSLAPAIEGALASAAQAGRELAVAVLVVGTDSDPQGVEEQIATLGRAGTLVCRTTEEMVEVVWNRLPPATEGISAPVPLGVLAPLAPPSGGTSPSLINLGLESFYDSLAAQGVAAIHVEWRPPAGGDAKLAALLERLKRA